MLIFCLYPDAKGDSPLSEETHFIYQASCKLAWSLCLSFMIYSCVTGNGGIINDFLSMKIWVPLSRLTYGAFLTHVIILVYFNSTQEHLVHLQDSVLIYYFIANLVFSFVASFLFSLFFEIPLIYCQIWIRVKITIVDFEVLFDYYRKKFCLNFIHFLDNYWKKFL